MAAAIAICSCKKDQAETPSTNDYKLSQTTLTLMETETATLSVENLAEGDKVTWKSADRTIASVTSKGKVSAKKAGETDITATIGKVELGCHVTVTEKPADLVLITGISLGSDFTLTEGQTRQLGVSVVPENATYAEEALANVTYTSDNETIASVSTSGLVSAGTVEEGGSGSAVITAQAVAQEKTYTATITVTVVSGVIKTTGISLDKATLRLNPGESGTLSYTLTPVDHTDSPSVSWTSSQESVATVSDGKVTAVDYGTAVITAKISDEISATCTVSVQDGPKAAYTIDMSSTYFTYEWPSDVSQLENVTLESWVLIGSTSSEQSFLGTEGVFLTRAQSGNYQAVTGGGSANGWTQSTEAVIKSTATAGEWHHVAATYSASDKKFVLYVDGANVAEGTSLLEGALPMNGIEGYTDGENPNIFMIGNSYGRSRFLQGNIAYVRVWKKACSAEEIAANMNKDDISDSDLIAYWKFNEGEGTVIHDFSGNNRELTVVGDGISWVEGTLPAVQ